MDKNECEDKYSESETEEHLNGKRDLFEWIRKQDGVTNAVLEGWIPETKQRPDIMFEYGEKKYVIEYQCSPIATEYVERHDLYKASGIIDIWIAGFEKYFKKNSRHKYIEEYICGYYNTSTKNFYIGENTEQGRFISSMHIKSHFLLTSFVFANKTIIKKTWINNNFDNLYELHKKRISLRKETEAINHDKSLKHVFLIEKYINSFNGYYELHTNYFPYKDCNNFITIYAKNHIDFNSKKIYINKKNFYKNIYDFKQTIVVTQKLNYFFDMWSNNLWGFKAWDKDEGIEINVYLFDSDINHAIRSFAICQHNDITIDNVDSIKELLTILMRKCIKKGLEGTNNIRIMEVRNN